jgi:hypothetical protein
MVEEANCLGQNRKRRVPFVEEHLQVIAVNLPGQNFQKVNIVIGHLITHVAELSQLQTSQTGMREQVIDGRLSRDIGKQHCKEPNNAIDYILFLTLTENLCENVKHLHFAGKSALQ